MTQLLPIVAAFAALWGVHDGPRPAVESEATQIGFAAAAMPNIPVRPDVVQFAMPTLFKRGNETLMINTSTTSEAGRVITTLTLTLGDKTADLKHVTSELETLLGSKAVRNFQTEQFIFVENNHKRTAVSEADSAAWSQHPQGRLIFVNVSDGRPGVMIMCMVNSAQ